MIKCAITVLNTKTNPLTDYDSHADALQLLRDAQHADHDLRQRAREAHLFIDKRDGQWEPDVWNSNSGKPRYTFDMVSPVVDQVAGEMEQADFNISVKPAGGKATKDIARVFDGLIRNIENISNATHIFSQAGRSMVTGGIDGWRVVQKFVDNSFDQDLVIEKISNFIDRVWLDPSAEMQDKHDAKWGFVLQGIDKKIYDSKWPDGKKQSLSTDQVSENYYFKADLIVVGEFYYIKQIKRDIVLMSNGRVYEDNDKYKKIKDELLQLGIKEEKRRSQKKNVVYTRKLDNGGWLEDEKETVFSFIPIVPTYGNFKIFENKTIYQGIVEKLIDPQRVYNYAKSREIEEGALAPRAKWWMTPKQAANHEATLSTLNTNPDPVQFFNFDPENPGPPQQSGGAQINQGLIGVSESMRQLIGQTAGMFAANMGDNPGLQSGIAIRQLQNKGDLGTIKYFQSQEIAICHTARILIDAIPKVYDTKRQVRILNEDGSFDISTINERVVDQQTGDVVVMNDLSQGTYDVTCSAGPAFKNRQQETTAALVEAAGVDPSILQIGADVFLNSIDAPGMDKIAERKRKQLFESGIIPEDQLTDQEREIAQAQAQQPPPPDAAVLLAEAETQKAQAAQAKVQADLQVAMERIRLEEEKGRLRELQLQIEIEKLNQKDQDSDISAAQKQQQFNLSLEKMRQDLMLAMNEQERKTIETISSIKKEQAETLKILREAIGVNTIIGPGNTQAYIEQAEIIADGGEDLASLARNRAETTV